jgi:hypothetical protein
MKKIKKTIAVNNGFLRLIEMKKKRPSNPSPVFS